MRLVNLFLAVVVVLLIHTVPALAQDATDTTEATVAERIGAGVGAGLVIVGAGIGLGLIGYSALAAIARQPEIAGQATTTMLIIAALLEGVVLFALIICLQL